MPRKLADSNQETLLYKPPLEIPALDSPWLPPSKDINALFVCPKKCPLRRLTFYVDSEPKLLELPIKHLSTPQNPTYLSQEIFKRKAKLFYSISTATPPTQLVRKI